MNTPIKTLEDFENEYQNLMNELASLETRLLEMHEREHFVRTELQHIEIQKQRLGNENGPHQN